MSEWRKHTGIERPAELAAAQIVEWRVNDGIVLADPAGSLNWAAELFSGSFMYYRPAIDPGGLPYVSSEGLEPETQYVAVDGDGEVNQFNAKPHFECFMELDVWTCSEEQDAWPDCPEASDSHAIPGSPEHSLARVWRNQ